MRIYESVSSETSIDVDLDRATISGRLYNIDSDPCIVRLLLTDICVEAGAVTTVSFEFGPLNTLSTTHSFRFEGDIVRASLWLRNFRLMVVLKDGESYEIALSSDLFQRIADCSHKSHALGDVACRGTSWLLTNRTEFAGIASNNLPNIGELPIYGIMVSGFGDVGWFDDEGEPNVKKYLDQIPRVFQAMAQHEKLIILIDMSNEGQALLKDWLTLLHDGLRERNIPLKCCVLLQQNRNLGAAYEAWMNTVSADRMHIAVYDYYPRRLVGYLSQQPLPSALTNQRRQKAFLCLNFTPRPNRTSFVSWLLGKDYGDAGYISFSAFDHAKYPSSNPEICGWFPQLEAVQRGFDVLKSNVPLLLDLDAREDKVPEYSLGEGFLYENSYFSIVTESEVTDGKLTRITEKIIKPLAMFHPLILLGNPNSLEIIKQYGFRTFGGFFDETYDSILDPADRVAKVMNEVDRVLALNGDELHKAYWDMMPTLRYNAAHARRVLNDQFKFHIEPELFGTIARAAR